MLGFLFYALCLAAEATASHLTAQAIERLQSQEKKEALQLLEKAFKKSKDPEQLREISILIIEASSTDYPKRENYLQYLARYSKNHPDQWKWYKELGDRHFDRGGLDTAEDWYLRARVFAEEKPIIGYKLAWVYWNQKRRSTAVETFLDVYELSDEGLKNQIRDHLARLWWETGEFPKTSFQRIKKWSEAEIQSLVNYVVERGTKIKSPGETQKKVILQLKTYEHTEQALKVALIKTPLFETTPCFFYDGIIDPEFQYSKSSLLACLQSEERPAAVEMLKFLETYKEAPDERIDWARAELFFEIGSFDEALRVLLNEQKIETRSKDFIAFTAQKIAELKTVDIAPLLPEWSTLALQNVLKRSNNQVVLSKLQQIEPQKWLEFEETLYSESKPPKEYWLKRGAWLAQNKSSAIEDLREVYTQLADYTESPSEKSARSQMENLKRAATKELPDQMSEDFIESHESWLKEIDRAVEIFKGLDPRLQMIVTRLSAPLIQRNVEHMLAEIDEMKSEGEWNEPGLTFQEKKDRMKDAIRRRYLDPSQEGQAQ